MVIPQQEKRDFFIQLDREFRNHPLHQQQDELYRLYPWTIEAVRNLFQNDPEKKQRFHRYTRKTGKSNVLFICLSRMADVLHWVPNV